MSKLQLIKRVVKGGYVKADTLGNGNWEIGRITDFDKIWVWFESAVDGETIRISRTDAHKATEKEYKEAIASNKEQLELATVARVQQEIAAEKKVDVDVNMGDMIPEDVEGMGDEDTQPHSVVKKSYRQKYQKVKAASGKTSQVCGDGVSIILAGKPLEEVYELVAEEMGLDIEKLHIKYEHLNPGQQRMCLGNRLRGFYRKNGKEEMTKK